MALKQSEDFLRFLTMGAAGTSAVLDGLASHYGHRCIELERYATANKIWARKIKRLRLADLVCIDCGVRVEVRTKSRLAIRMSHSDTPDRAWDAGLRNTDLVAFLAWDADRGRVSGHHNYFYVADLRDTVAVAKLGPRKAASEGAERDLTWPSRVPKRTGRVVDLDPRAGKASFQPDGGRLQTYRIKDTPVFAYSPVGATLDGGEQFLIGSVRKADGIDCPGAIREFASDLWSDDPIDRYTAVKVAGFAPTKGREHDRLLALSVSEGEDPRIRLEAIGSLCRHDESHVDSLLDWVREGDDGTANQVAMAMESTFILSELRTPRAISALDAIAAEPSTDSELRCAAVWGLGVGGVDEPASVLPHVASQDTDLAVHALAAIGSLGVNELDLLRSWVSGDSDRKAASAATLLLDEGPEGLKILLEIALNGGRPALWAMNALGRARPEDVREVAGTRLPKRLENALAPMWIAQRSWLSEDGEPARELALLRKQSIGHYAPPKPLA